MNELNATQREELFKGLQRRFEKNTRRHKGLEWAAVRAKLEASPAKLRSLHEMEATGGEPDVVGYEKKTGEYVFMDCSEESPKGRRSVCYDREGCITTARNLIMAREGFGACCGCEAGKGISRPATRGF